jgi:hypothetical protein
MTAVLVQVITSGSLRATVRSKLRTGASRETISLLIGAFVPTRLRSGRWHGIAPRVPVELIPHRRRADFLAALSALPAQRVATRRSLASWLSEGLRAADKKNCPKDGRQ